MDALPAEIWMMICDKLSDDYIRQKLYFIPLLLQHVRRHCYRAYGLTALKWMKHLQSLYAFDSSFPSSSLLILPPSSSNSMIDSSSITRHHLQQFTLITPKELPSLVSSFGMHHRLSLELRRWNPSALLPPFLTHLDLKVPRIVQEGVWPLPSTLTHLSMTAKRPSRLIIACHHLVHLRLENIHLTTMTPLNANLLTLHVASGIEPTLYRLPAQLQSYRGRHLPEVLPPTLIYLNSRDRFTLKNFQSLPPTLKHLYLYRIDSTCTKIILPPDLLTLCWMHDTFCDDVLLPTRLQRVILSHNPTWISIESICARLKFTSVTGGKLTPFVLSP